jgi:hypothetical protein
LAAGHEVLLEQELEHTTVTAVRRQGELGPRYFYESFLNP